MVEPPTKQELQVCGGFLDSARFALSCRKPVSKPPMSGMMNREAGCAAEKTTVIIQNTKAYYGHLDSFTTITSNRSFFTKVSFRFITAA
jgi:hypothetical protein